MKKLIVITYLLFTAYSYSDSWVTDWSNGGNGWIGGWHIANTDVYLTGNFIHGNYNNNSQQDLFCINPDNGWAGVYYYSNNAWVNSWSNGGSGRIGETYINLPDVTYVFFPHYNGFNNFLMVFMYGPFINNCVGAMTWNNGDFGTIYENCTNHINGWIVRSDDRLVVGNFDNSTPSDELLLINHAGGWAYMCHFNTSAFNDLWSNGGSGTLPGWILRETDTYFSADVDGDDIDELVCVNPNNGWSTIFKYVNGNWNGIWSNGGDGLLGGWKITFQSKWTGFSFGIPAGENNEEIFNVDWYNGWSTVKRYDGSPTYWPDLWTNYGSHWIDGWFIQSSDYYNFGNFELSPTSFFLPINKPTGWATMMHLQAGSLIENNTSNEAKTHKSNIKIPENFILSQNYPNPFNPVTKISFGLPKDNYVKIVVYDLLGNEISTLVNELRRAGTYELNFDASELASGTYLYKMTAGDFFETKKFTIVK